MDSTMVTIGIVVCIVIAGAVALFFYKKKTLTQLFSQVYESSRQVPKQKKNSFLLFMFKESIMSSKKKTKSSPAKLNNPKYIEMQMLQMTRVLKDPSKVEDKNMKKALQLLSDYQKWEKDIRINS